MMVEYGEAFWGSRWASLYGVARRQSPGRHAVAPLRHLRHGRPPARRDGRGPGPSSAGRTPRRSASRWSTWASTTSSTSRPASRWPRACAPRTPAVAPAAARVGGRRPGARGAGAAMSEAAAKQREARPPEVDDHSDEGAGAPAHAPQPARARRLPRSPRSPPSTSCCRSSPASTTPGGAWRTAGPPWLGAAFVLTCGMFAGYVALFRGIYAGVTDRIDWAASYQITMAGLAASRLFAAGGAGGLVLTAWALRRAGVAKRDRGRQDDGLPRADLLPLRRRGRDLRVRPALGPLRGHGPVRLHVRAGRHRPRWPC